jgi:hypothetical protein
MVSKSRMLSEVILTSVLFKVIVRLCYINGHCKNAIQGHYNNMIQGNCNTNVDGPIRCSSFALKREEQLKTLTSIDALHWIRTSILIFARLKFFQTLDLASPELFV